MASQILRAAIAVELTRTHRRTCLLLLPVIALGVVILAKWWNRPTSSDFELQLVGEWTQPMIHTPQDMGVPVGPLAKPLHLIEFRPDLVFREWFASTDRREERYIVLEG